MKGYRQKLKEKSEHKEVKKKIVKSVAISEEGRELNLPNTVVINVKNPVRKVLTSDEQKGLKQHVIKQLRESKPM